MKTYMVNATKIVAAYVTIEAETPEEALAEAQTMSPWNFDTDEGSAEIEFNVTPAVETF